MKDKPKGGGFLPIGVGVLAIGCCLGPVVFGSLFVGLAGWFSGLTLGGIGALAGLAAFIVYVGARLWRARTVVRQAVPIMSPTKGKNVPDE